MRFAYHAAMCDPDFYLPLAVACEEVSFDPSLPDSSCDPQESGHRTNKLPFRLKYEPPHRGRALRARGGRTNEGELGHGVVRAMSPSHRDHDSGIQSSPSDEVRTEQGLRQTRGDSALQLTP